MPGRRSISVEPEELAVASPRRSTRRKPVHVDSPAPSNKAESTTGPSAAGRSRRSQSIQEKSITDIENDLRKSNESTNTFKNKLLEIDAVETPPARRSRRSSSLQSETSEDKETKTVRRTRKSLALKDLPPAVEEEKEYEDSNDSETLENVATAGSKRRITRSMSRSPVDTQNRKVTTFVTNTKKYKQSLNKDLHEITKPNALDIIAENEDENKVENLPSKSSDTPKDTVNNNFKESSIVQEKLNTSEAKELEEKNESEDGDQLHISTEENKKVENLPSKSSDTPQDTVNDSFKKSSIVLPKLNTSNVEKTECEDGVQLNTSTKENKNVENSPSKSSDASKDLANNSFKKAAILLENIDTFEAEELEEKTKCEDDVQLNISTKENKEVENSPSKSSHTPKHVASNNFKKAAIVLKKLDTSKVEEFEEKTDCENDDQLNTSTKENKEVENSPSKSSHTPKHLASNNFKKAAIVLKKLDTSKGEEFEEKTDCEDDVQLNSSTRKDNKIKKSPSKSSEAEKLGEKFECEDNDHLNTSTKENKEVENSPSKSSHTPKHVASNNFKKAAIVLKKLDTSKVEEFEEKTDCEDDVQLNTSTKKDNKIKKSPSKSSEAEELGEKFKCEDDDKLNTSTKENKEVENLPSKSSHTPKHLASNNFKKAAIVLKKLDTSKVEEFEEKTDCEDDVQLNTSTKEDNKIKKSPSKSSEAEELGEKFKCEDDDKLNTSTKENKEVENLPSKSSHTPKHLASNNFKKAAIVLKKLDTSKVEEFEEKTDCEDDVQLNTSTKKDNKIKKSPSKSSEAEELGEKFECEDDNQLNTSTKENKEIDNSSSKPSDIPKDLASSSLKKTATVLEKLDTSKAEEFDDKTECEGDDQLNAFAKENKKVENLLSKSSDTPKDISNNFKAAAIVLERLDTSETEKLEKKSECEDDNQLNASKKENKEDEYLSSKSCDTPKDVESNNFKKSAIVVERLDISEAEELEEKSENEDNTQETVVEKLDISTNENVEKKSEVVIVSEKLDSSKAEKEIRSNIKNNETELKTCDTRQNDISPKKKSTTTKKDDKYEDIDQDTSSDDKSEGNKTESSEDMFELKLEENIIDDKPINVESPRRSPRISHNKEKNKEQEKTANLEKIIVSNKQNKEILNTDEEKLNCNNLDDALDLDKTKELSRDEDAKDNQSVNSEHENTNILLVCEKQSMDVSTLNDEEDETNISIVGSNVSSPIDVSSTPVKTLNGETNDRIEEKENISLLLGDGKSYSPIISPDKDITDLAVSNSTPKHDKTLSISNVNNKVDEFLPAVDATETLAKETVEVEKDIFKTPISVKKSQTDTDKAETADLNDSKTTSVHTPVLVKTPKKSNKRIDTPISADNKLHSKRISTDLSESLKENYIGATKDNKKTEGSKEKSRDEILDDFLVQYTAEKKRKRTLDETDESVVLSKEKKKRKSVQDINFTDSEEDDSEYEKCSFLDDMASEASEESTPSVDSLEIIDEGESIGSSDSQIDSDDDYEHGSFVVDDDVGNELLSGDDDDYIEKRDRLEKGKRKRIIQIHDSESEDDFDKMSVEPFGGMSPSSVSVNQLSSVDSDLESIKTKNEELSKKISDEDNEIIIVESNEVDDNCKEVEGSKDVADESVFIIEDEKFVEDKKNEIENTNTEKKENRKIEEDKTEFSGSENNSKKQNILHDNNVDQLNSDRVANQEHEISKESIESQNDSLLDSDENKDEKYKELLDKYFKQFNDDSKIETRKDPDEEYPTKKRTSKKKNKRQNLKSNAVEESRKRFEVYCQKIKEKNENKNKENVFNENSNEERNELVIENQDEMADNEKVENISSVTYEMNTSGTYIVSPLKNDFKSKNNEQSNKSPKQLKDLVEVHILTPNVKENTKLKLVHESNSSETFIMKPNESPAHVKTASLTKKNLKKKKLTSPNNKQQKISSSDNSDNSKTFVKNKSLINLDNLKSKKTQNNQPSNQLENSNKLIIKEKKKWKNIKSLTDFESGEMHTEVKRRKMSKNSDSNSSIEIPTVEDTKTKKIYTTNQIKFTSDHINLLKENKITKKSKHIPKSMKTEIDISKFSVRKGKAAPSKSEYLSSPKYNSNKSIKLCKFNMIKPSRAGCTNQSMTVECINKFSRNIKKSKKNSNKHKHLKSTLTSFDVEEIFNTKLVNRI